MESESKQSGLSTALVDYTEEIESLTRTKEFVCSQAAARCEKNQKFFSSIVDVSEELLEIEKVISRMDPDSEKEAIDNLNKEIQTLRKKHTEFLKRFEEKKVEEKSHLRECRDLKDDIECILGNVNALNEEMKGIELEVEKIKGKGKGIEMQNYRENQELVALKSDIAYLDNEIQEIERVCCEDEIELERLKNEVDMYNRVIVEKEIDLKVLVEKEEFETRDLEESNEKLMSFREYAQKKKGTGYFEDNDSRKLMDSSFKIGDSETEKAKGKVAVTKLYFTNYIFLVIIVVLLILIIVL